MRILYVEDNPANVFLVKRVAKMGQHEIINFIDGGEAIRKYDDVNPDLVLMDIQLVGDTSGLEVVKILRGRGVKTPIIAVTAYAMVGDKERCMDAGCNDYLAKPLPIPRLIEIFQDYDKSIKAAASALKSATSPAAPVAPPSAVPVEKVASTPVQSEVQTPAELKPETAPVVAETKSKTAPLSPAEVSPEVASAPDKAETPATEAKVEVAPQPEMPQATSASDTPTVTTSTDAATPVQVAADTGETKQAETATPVQPDPVNTDASANNIAKSDGVTASTETPPATPESTPASPIGDDRTEPRKPETNNTASLETPNTQASPTEANG